MSKKLRPIISLILLVIAIGAGVFYVDGHRPLLRQLSHTPPRVSLLVLVLYALMFGVLLLILSASILICQRKLVWRENVQLNAHSLFINFFVPGQGGPAYRGLYLYKRHKLRVKNYIIVTLLYYAIYAIINVCLLLGGQRPWWQIIIAAVIVAAVSLAVIDWYAKRSKLSRQSLDLTTRNVGYLFLATLAQAVVQIAIYAVELHSANSHVRLSQVITYTGAANMALFVSLTPGAIGIRESFLIFTEHLHHISSANIIVANVIDRSVYLVFLLILMSLTAGMYLKAKRRLKPEPAEE